MSFARLLRRRRGSGDERRKAPRIRCRLNCTMVRGRRRVPARVLDVSEGGLCLLSPVELKAKQPIALEIDVPPGGPVLVEAIAWHIRPVKSGRAGKKTWSIGMMITKAGDGFQALIPRTPAPDAVASNGSADGSIDGSADTEPDWSELDLEAEELSPEWEESSAQWDQLFADAEQLLEDSEQEAEGEGDLQMFRVRVKACKGPRTRLLTLSAASESEAEELARADIDTEAWMILEVAPA